MLFMLFSPRLFILQSATTDWSANETQPRKNLVIHLFHVLLIYNKVFSVVANARGVNKVEWIQEVACQMEFISRDSFGVNCVLATELLHQLCRANAAVLSEWDGSEMEVSSRATLRPLAINKSHHICPCLILLGLLPTRKWNLCSALFFTRAVTDFKELRLSTQLSPTRQEGLQQINQV